MIDDRAEVTLRMLTEAARDNGMRVTGDGRIGEADAAALLGWKPKTLADRRTEGRAPQHYRMPVGEARLSYRLHDLAEWIEAQREGE